MAAAEKAALHAFAASLFFEQRSKGIRVTSIHPTPTIPKDAIARALAFPVRVGKTSCVECVDLTTIKPFPNGRSGRGACFVTGGSKGIGKSIAVRVAKEMRIPIAIHGRDQASLEQAAQECAEFVGAENVMTFAFDARDNGLMKKALEETAKKFNGIEMLVCSAGINQRKRSVSPDGKSFADPERWQELMQINVGASMSATAYALPHMIQRKSGASIFFIGSRGIRIGGSPGQQSYVASKMAISGFAGSVQHEVKDHGVRVVCLNVGLVATDLGTKAPKSGAFTPAPAKLQIQPNDVADCVCFAHTLDPSVSAQTFDMCGVNEDFLDKDGKSLKMSAL